MCTGSVDLVKVSTIRVVVGFFFQHKVKWPRPCIMGIFLMSCWIAVQPALVVNYIPGWMCSGSVDLVRVSSMRVVFIL